MVDATFPFQELKQLLLMLHEAQVRADEHAKAAHGRFNVFTTILQAHDEVRLHTRFLHCLLNPKGTHDCGAIFLKLFFSTLKECTVLDNENKKASIDFPDPNESWGTEKEYPTADGKFDILIKKHTEFGLGIENKIYAGEQDLQVKRYSEWLSSQFKVSHAIYLTLYGEESRTNEGKSYLRISYAEHILNWLEKCLRETYTISPVNQILQQYKAVVLDLTGKNLNPYMNPIIEFITKNPDIICCRKQLNEGINKAIAEFWDSLANGIQKELQEFRIRPHEKRKFGVGPYGALVIEKTSKIPFDIYIELDNEQEYVLAVGIAFEKPCSEYEEFFKQMYKKLREYPKDGGGFSSNWPAGWRNLIEDLDDDKNLAKLIKTPILRIVMDVCEDIRSYIALLEQTYAETKQISTQA